MKFDIPMMKTAYIWAEESYCKRKQVGCVIANEERIISHGFNGTISGLPNECEETKEEMYCKRCECTDQSKLTIDENISVGSNICTNCYYTNVVKVKKIPIDKTNVFTLHAEANAILWAARKGYALEGATLYVTLEPCADCSKLIAQSGITRVMYSESYSPEGVEFLRKCNIEVTQLEQLTQE